MRIGFSKLRAVSLKGAAMAGVCGLATAGLLATPLIGTPADAGSRTYSSLNPVTGEARIHDSSVTSRSVTLPYSKSTVVELPADLADLVVSNPEIVEAVTHTSRRTILIGKAPGQTNAFFYGHDGRELLSLDIRVERDMKGLHSLIARHVPDAEVEIQGINNNILLTGSVPDASTSNRLQSLAEMWLDEAAGGGAGEVVNLLAVEGRDQVMLKVKIVEMQRSVTKQLGIDLEAVGQLGDATVSLLSANGIATGAGLSAGANWVNQGDGDLKQLNSSLSALERVGLVRTMAEPTLTAISGETASFLSGGEFPLLSGTTVDNFGRLTRQFTFKPYGVSLGFTPIVLSEGRISLNISTEVSEPTTEGSFEGIGGDILGLRVRRADSVVEIPAGGSLVIAGLIREETRQSSDGTPGLKDIPALGAAFRNRDDLQTQQELMIIVTPYLVEATHPDKLQTPIDAFVPATDSQAVVMGRINDAHSGPAQARPAPAGYRPAARPGLGHVLD